jgi:rfaE bifunctional protein kinase chain/domain
MSTQDLFAAFNGKRILVLGDVMIDAYQYGQVNRMSPEAPVPVLDFEKEEQRIGGAGNVALNISALGAEPYIASVIGTDAAGQQLKALFSAANINLQALVSSNERRTTIKTRVLSNSKQLLRIDTEDTHDLSSSEEIQLKAQINFLFSAGLDGIILEDYNKGVLSPNLISWIIQEAQQRNIPTAVDPKKKNFLSYTGCTLFKPNLKEIKEGLELDFNYKQNPAALNAALVQLQAQLQNKYTFVTLSEDGVQLFDGEQQFHFPAHLRNISDVSGAGDTVVATACLCLVCGASQQIASIANLAGGLVCETPGVVPINKNQLLQEALENL